MIANSYTGSSRLDKIEHLKNTIGSLIVMGGVEGGRSWVNVLIDTVEATNGQKDLQMESLIPKSVRTFLTELARDIRNQTFRP